MGLFTGIKDAKQMNASVPLDKVGRYYQLIQEVRTGTTQSGNDFMAVDKVVVHVLDDHDGEGHALGEDCSSLFTKGGKYPAYFFSNVKNFICSAMAVADEDIDEDVAEMVVSKEQPLRGIVVEISSFLKHKRDKKDETYVSTRYIRRVPAAEIRATLDEESLLKFFPGDALAEMEKAEQAEGEG